MPPMPLGNGAFKIYTKNTNRKYLLQIIDFETPKRPSRKARNIEDDEYIAIRKEFLPYRPRFDDQWEDFQSCPPHPIDISPIQWWCQPEQVKRWPILSAMALDIMSISAMSDDVEGSFSKGRRTITWDRMRLGVESIQSTECLKSWYQDLRIHETSTQGVQENADQNRADEDSGDEETMLVV